MTFDFARYRAAMETKDADTWVTMFAESAVWTEYRHANPPSSPNVMSGRPAIESFVRGVCAAPLTIAISHEVVTDDRAAYMLTCVLPDGRTVLENVIVDLADGKITNQIDVEAWEP